MAKQKALFVIKLNFHNTWTAKQSHFPQDIWPVFRCKKKREAGFAPRFFTEDLDAD